MTIKLIRMWSGEDVIADVIEENEYTITMEDPIVAVPSQKQDKLHLLLGLLYIKKEK